MDVEELAHSQLGRASIGDLGGARSATQTVLPLGSLFAFDQSRLGTGHRLEQILLQGAIGLVHDTRAVGAACGHGAQQRTARVKRLGSAPYTEISARLSLLLALHRCLVALPLSLRCNTSVLVIVDGEPAVALILHHCCCRTLDVFKIDKAHRANLPHANVTRHCGEEALCCACTLRCRNCRLIVSKGDKERAVGLGASCAGGVVGIIRNFFCPRPPLPDLSLALLATARHFFLANRSRTP